MLGFREVKDSNKMDRIQRDPYREKKEGNWWCAAFVLMIGVFIAMTPMVLERDASVSAAEDCGVSLYACVTKRCQETADKRAKYNTSDLGCIDSEIQDRYREECRTKLMQEYQATTCLTPAEAEYEREMK